MITFRSVLNYVSPVLLLLCLFQNAHAQPVIEPIEGGDAVRIHVESEEDFIAAVEIFNQNDLDTIIRAHPQLTFTAEYSNGSGSPFPAIPVFRIATRNYTRLSKLKDAECPM